MSSDLRKQLLVIICTKELIFLDGSNDRLVELLRARGLHISSAESCTGGLFSAYITDVPGSSEVFDEAVVTYSNDAKIRELGVSGQTLAQKGAVSRDVARQMAEGIRRRTGADVGVGITGIAGPDGGTDKKPVGTVFVGIDICGSVSVYHLLINGSRAVVRTETCRFVFERLIDAIG